MMKAKNDHVSNGENIYETYQATRRCNYLLNTKYCQSHEMSVEKGLLHLLSLFQMRDPRIQSSTAFSIGGGGGGGGTTTGLVSTPFPDI